MSTQTLSYYEVVSEMPDDMVEIFRDVSWEEYEELLEQVGEASGLRISYDDGTMKVMTLSTKHENYARFFEKLMAAISLRLRINIRSFGSATMRKRRRRKGVEPDACFYVQTADVIGNRIELDFAVDPPPDIVLEVDVHHDSQDKFPIYAGLEVPEIWRYDGYEVIIHHLQEDEYVEQEASLALPMITARVLTDFMARFHNEGELQALLAFDEWIQSIAE
ncbi:MAG: Uma2 family endonuclease [Blastocatellia bacterium]